MKDILIQVKNLSTAFKEEGRSTQILYDVSFNIYKGEVLGIVGESGSGKSVTSKTIMRLIPEPPAQILNGEVLFEGDPNQNVLQYSESQMCHFRGDKVAMIFQEPMTSLNPVLTCGYQISEALLLHQKISKAEAKQKAIDMLRMVGIQSPESRYNCYPHELSGGMRQRVMIAMALCCNPELLIADEPTTALDPTIQAQILELIGELQKQHGMTVMYITHDLGVVAETCQRAIVMYAGRIMEVAKVTDLFRNPAHPYTEGLMKAMPKLHEKCDRLYNIEGNVPNFAQMPQGCAFHDRCPDCMEICKTQQPQLVEIGEDHQVRCWKAQQAAASAQGV